MHQLSNLRFTDLIKSWRCPSTSTLLEIGALFRPHWIPYRPAICMRSVADDQFQSRDRTSIISSIETAILQNSAFVRMLIFVRFFFHRFEKTYVRAIQKLYLYFIHDKINFKMRQSIPKQEMIEHTRCLSNCRRLGMKRMYVY